MNPLHRTQRELTAVMRQMQIALPPQPQTRLYALLPDQTDGTMMKAMIPGRLRSTPSLPVVTAAAISQKLLRTRPRKAPVVFIKSKPDWRRDLMDLVDRFERGQMVFLDPRYCTGVGCFDLS